jgi:hypothetical protein
MSNKIIFIKYGTIYIYNTILNVILLHMTLFYDILRTFKNLLLIKPPPPRKKLYLRHWWFDIIKSLYNQLSH